MVTILAKWYIIKPPSLCWRDGGLTRLCQREWVINYHSWYYFVIPNTLSSTHAECMVRSRCSLFSLPLIRMNFRINPRQCSSLSKLKVHHKSHFWYPILIKSIQLQYICSFYKHSNNPKHRQPPPLPIARQWSTL